MTIMLRKITTLSHKTRNNTMKNTFLKTEIDRVSISESENVVNNFLRTIKETHL